MPGNRLKMSQNTRRKVLKISQERSLWCYFLYCWRSGFAHIRAVSETAKSIYIVCAQLVLDKTERVICKKQIWPAMPAEQYQGEAWPPAHQQRMLNIINGLYDGRFDLC